MFSSSLLSRFHFLRFLLVAGALAARNGGVDARGHSLELCRAIGRPLGVGPTQRVRRGRELTLANGVFRLAGGHFRRARDEDLAQREAGVGGDGAVSVEVLGVRRRLGVAVAVDPLVVVPRHRVAGRDRGGARSGDCATRADALATAGGLAGGVARRGPVGARRVGARGVRVAAATRAVGTDEVVATSTTGFPSRVSRYAAGFLCHGRL